MNFSFTTTGESHGPALIATIEGLPAGLPISQEFINHELWRRQQGFGRGGRMGDDGRALQCVVLEDLRKRPRRRRGVAVRAGPQVALVDAQR